MHCIPSLLSSYLTGVFVDLFTLMSASLSTAEWYSAALLHLRAFSKLSENINPMVKAKNIIIMYNQIINVSSNKLNITSICKYTDFPGNPVVFIWNFFLFCSFSWVRRWPVAVLLLACVVRDIFKIYIS